MADPRILDGSCAPNRITNLGYRPVPQIASQTMTRTRDRADPEPKMWPESLVHEQWQRPQLAPSTPADRSQWEGGQWQRQLHAASLDPGNNAR